MKRFGTLSASALFGALALAAVVVACEEDGKTVPERCSDPPLPLFDIQTAGAPSDDNRRFNHTDDEGHALPPCVTEVGHAVSSFGDGSAGEAASTGGSGGSSGSGGGGSSSGGSLGGGGSPDAGAGGA